MQKSPNCGERHPHQLRNVCQCGRHTGFYSVARARWRADADHHLCRACSQALVDAERRLRHLWNAQAS